jgi:hypothetical protein
VLFFASDLGGDEGLGRLDAVNASDLADHQAAEPPRLDDRVPGAVGDPRNRPDPGQRVGLEPGHELRRMKPLIMSRRASVARAS